MDGKHFFFGYLPFWVVTYGLALAGWACLGRFLMQAFTPEDSPNYIWRGFRLLTGWAIAAARRLVPSYVTPPFLPLVAAFWLFALRFAIGFAMLAAGLAPRITPAAGAGGS
jgi:hypothetical protein